MPALVFDLGGTYLRCGVASQGVIRHNTKQRIKNYLDGLSPEAIGCGITEQIAAYIGEVAGGTSPQDPIIFSFPGPIEDRRIALDAPTVFGNTNGRLPDLPGELRRRTRREVHLLNDVSAAAWYLSRKTTARRFMVVTVSSGIGSKVFDRAHPSGVLDDPPFAGEIGHYVVDPTSCVPLCDCGGIGHLGAIASGRGVEQAARRARQDANLTNEVHIVPAICAGEGWAMDILKRCTEPLARTLLAVTMGVGIEKIFIIGGFAQSIGPEYVRLLNELLAANSRYHVVANTIKTIIESGKIDEESCLEGAAVYAAALGLES